MALGEILRNARVQRGMSPSDVAESTRMMVQVVEGLEREDFRRIAAPIYGRGFIKLYAELLELDPEPLIRDFMELYDGARAPAVRTKKVEPAAETASATAPVPVTRTVSGQAPLAPQRQTVQPRPAVRVLVPVAAEPENSSEARPVVREEEEEKLPVAQAAAPERAEPKPEAVSKAADAFVVAPEESDAEPDEPDLFHPKPLRRQAGESFSAQPADDAPANCSRQPPKRKYPIFKIGGRLDEPLEPVASDEESRARRHARIQAFMDGVSKLKAGVKDGVRGGMGLKLPGHLSQKQLWTLGGVGAMAVVLMVCISVLFKVTGSNVKEAPAVIIERVAPPPALYVD